MRDHALLSFIYNTGARIQEALDLCPETIRFEAPACVRLQGKGGKERVCPLWPETAMVLKVLLEQQPRWPEERLFVNRYGRPLSASGVRFKLAAYVRAATETIPTLRTKHVTPHSWAPSLTSAANPPKAACREHLRTESRTKQSQNEQYSVHRVRDGGLMGVPSFRHATAVHLVSAGVDVAVIRS